MTSNPDKAARKVDIKNLLNLLNASEVSSAASDVSAEIIDEPKVPLASPLASLKKLVAASVENQKSADVADAGIADSLENPHVLDRIDQESPEDDPENRFAAHIVQGMSKLKRQ
jgi:hypothetical protein